MVYVDDAFIPHNNKTWCHLMADTDQELEAFAHRVGLPKSWKHGDHYDLVSSQRLHVIRNGAQRVTAREMVGIRRRLRKAKTG